MRQVGKIVIHTHHVDHGLTVLEHGQRHILQRLSRHLNLRLTADLRQNGVVGRSGLAPHRHHLQLRVKIGEKSGHQVLKAVENRKHDDKRRRCHGHADDRYQGDNVDGVRLLL